MEAQKEEWNGVLDPRMKLVWKYYTDPKSETFNNANASAIKAGYSESYSRVITGQDWFKTKLRRMGLLRKAEKVLENTLTMDITDENGKVQADLSRVQTDVAKFIAKTQGKNEGYSERTEVTGKDGQGIVFMPVELLEKYNLKHQNGEGTIQEDSGDTGEDEISELGIQTDTTD